MEPGIYTDLSNEKYHSSPGISKSGLDLIAKCPALYKHRYIDGNHPEPTKAMLMGSAVHKLVLEPDDFDREFAVAPEINRRTKAGREQWAEFTTANKFKIILPMEEYDKARAMADAVLGHTVAASVLSRGQAETSIFHEDEDTGQLVKVRPDWVTEDILADLKTTADASPEAFSKACFNYRYYVQAGMYLDVANRAHERTIIANDRQFSSFVFICVENREPYQVAVYVADPDMVELGRLEYWRLLSIYTSCVEDGHWPGYNSGRVSMISLPRWAVSK